MKTIELETLLDQVMLDLDNDGSYSLDVPISYLHLVEQADTIRKLIKAVRMAAKYADAERRDMLSKAGAYGENALAVAMRSDHWRHVMETNDLLKEVL